MPHCWLCDADYGDNADDDDGDDDDPRCLKNLLLSASIFVCAKFCGLKWLGIHKHT